MIPAGGAGTRLWPRSRRARPKHFLPLGGGGSLLARTYARVAPLTRNVHVLTEAAQAGLVREQLPGAGLILEPTARGTTSAFGLAALTLMTGDPGAVMVTAPADHLVADAAAFQAALRRAAAVAAASDRLVAIGLRPTHAATGYGYIDAGGEVPGIAGALEARGFVEKPDAETAAAYLAGGTHYWNLAMFAWRAEVFRRELGRLSPGHLAGLEEVLEARLAGDEERAARVYATLSDEAVDYAIMQRTDRLVMVPASFDWSDVGSWPEMLETVPADAAGNRSAADLVAIDASGCLVDAPGRLVALIGVSDLVVVDTGDALLVCHRDRAQEVKQVVAELVRTGRSQYL